MLPQVYTLTGGVQVGQYYTVAGRQNPQRLLAQAARFSMWQVTKVTVDEDGVPRWDSTLVNAMNPENLGNKFHHSVRSNWLFYTGEHDPAHDPNMAGEIVTVPG